MIEMRICKWQRTGVSDLEVQAGIVISAFGVFDIGGRQINAADAADTGIAGKANAQISSAAADVEDATCVIDASEVDQQRR